MCDFSKMTLAQLLEEKGFDCACGRHHATLVKHIKIGAGVVNELPEMLHTIGSHKAYVVCDPDTWTAAGERVVSILDRAGFPYTLTKIREHEPEPDEYTLGQLAMSFDSACDIIVAVGSGVVNDLSKMLGLVSGRRSVIVGTAPSMDGFASNSSSMLIGGVKVSIYNPCPIGIIADTDILCKAPMRMLQAGLGDMLAKYVSVCEWRLTNLVTGEYYCENIASLVRSSVKKIVAEAEKLPRRDPQAIANIVEGLIMSGITMSFAGVSRPASGVEHYFSHMWDMHAIENHTHADLHGIQVGVGTLLTLRIYDWIREIKPDRARAEAFMKAFDVNRWTREIHRLFGSTAGQILEIEEKTHKNDPQKHAARLDRILSHWDDILKIIDEELPTYEQLNALMLKVGMPTKPSDLGLDAKAARDAFVGARDIRDKYMSCSLLWDLGLLEEFGARLENSL